MAKNVRTVGGRQYEEHGLYRNVEFNDGEGKKVEKKLEAISLVPVAPMFEDDEAAMLWLNDAIEQNVFTAKQVVKWVLAQIPINAGSVAFPGVVGKNAKAKELKFTPAEMVQVFAFRAQAIQNVGPNPDSTSEQSVTIYESTVYAESLRLFTKSKEAKMDYSSWRAEDHVVMPSQIG